MTIFIMEGTARVAFAIEPLFTRIRDFDSASERLAWVHYRGAEASFNEWDELLGWRNKKNVRMTAFGGKPLTINADGWRATQNYDLRPSTRRIIAIGDSTTFGEEVGDSETYPYYLQSLMTTTEIINLGIRGYGHDQILLNFKLNGRKYQPDVVMLGFLEHDMFRNIMDFKDYAKPKYQLINGQLRLANIPIPHPDEFMAGELYRSKFMDLISMLEFRVKGRLGYSQAEVNAVSTAILEELLREIKGMGAEAKFVYLPIEAETAGDDYFETFCHAHAEVDCLNLRPSLAGQQDIKAPYGHYNAKGNKLIAEAIAKWLK